MISRKIPFGVCLLVFSLNVFIKSAKRWTALIVARILHNKAYIGTFISNKSVTIAPKIKKINSAENRIIIENHHPAIIDKDVFENVTKRFNKSGHSKKDNSFYSELKGKVKCGCCGKLLTRHYLSNYAKNIQTKMYLTCDYGTLQNCCKERIYVEPLKNTVIEILTAQIQLVMADFEALKNNISNGIEINEQAEKKLLSELELCKKQKSVLYTDYKSGIFTAAQYLEKRESLNEKVSALNEQLLELAEHKGDRETVNTLNDIINTLKNDTITQEQLIKDYIKEINVYASDKIEVKFSFEDLL